jgi:hypothetical protein
MPDDEFKLRAGIYWLSQEFAPYLRAKREIENDPDARAAMERKWIILYAASQVFRLLYSDEAWKGQVRKLYRGDWTMTDEKKGKAITAIFEAAKAGTVMAYKNSKKYSANFVHRNWMRSKSTPLEITDVLRTVVVPLVSTVGEIPG